MSDDDDDDGRWSTKKQSIGAEVGNEGGRGNKEQGDIVKCVDVFQSHKCSNFS